MIRKRAFISGHVQGVFFRASTAREAGRLGVSGWARNLADGRVEVLAEGENAAVLALLAWLRKGPPLARVAAVEVRDEVATCDLTGFSAR